jgi:alkanesulfonate monooxygenase SsuD/methylene tetrahydromethanopterin reductase-like flavin-dependent oxidoreductase (luciferase family)
VKVGVFTGPQQVSWEALRDVWLHADEHRYDSAWTWDHIIALHGDLDDPHYEGWTLLAALAALTKHVQVGHLVTANTLRHPALLGKMAATVDHVSGGRLVVGIGNGYYAEEHDRFGIPLPDKVTRAAMLRESIQVLKGMWAPGRLTFAGEHYRITDAPAEPKPVNGSIPLLLGGAGERMLRLTAQEADLWNLPDGQYGIDLERLKTKVETLERYCDEIGRDPGEIEKTMSLTLFVDPDAAALKRLYDAFHAYRGWDEATTRRHVVLGSPAEVIEELKAFEAVGLQHFIIHLVPGSNYEDLAIFSETVLPHIR